MMIVRYYHTIFLGLVCISILFRNHHHVIPMTTTTTKINIKLDQYDQQNHHHDQYDQQADMKFVNKLPQPNFRQKNFTHEKRVNHSQ